MLTITSAKFSNGGRATILSDGQRELALCRSAVRDGYAKNVQPLTGLPRTSEAVTALAEHVNFETRAVASEAIDAKYHAEARKAPRACYAPMVGVSDEFILSLC